MSLLDLFTFGNEPPETPFTKTLEQNLDKFFSKLRSILNKGLNFQDNFNCLKTTITTSVTPGNTTVITHGLGRIPVGVLILETDKAAHIFTSAKTATTYTIKSDTASVTATLVIL